MSWCRSHGFSAGAGAFVVVAFVLYLEFKAPLRIPGPSWKVIGPAPKPPVTPPKRDGVYTANHLLHKSKHLFRGKISGSESIAFGPDGHLYMLDKFGAVLRAASSGDDESIEQLAHLGAGGRPLGFHFDALGNLIICNAGIGLQMLERGTNHVILLTSDAPTSSPRSERRPIRYANDLAIASDGSIYFTDSGETPPAINAAGFYDTLDSYLKMVAEVNYCGRLLRYDPSTRETFLVADGFWFINGVVLAEDESFAVVSESTLSRLTRLWLKGPKAGQREVLHEGAVGYPDGITRGGNGSFWVALTSPRQPVLEFALRSRLFRWIFVRLPAVLMPDVKGGGVVQVSAEGEPLRYLADVDGSHLRSLSAVTVREEGLYFGNLGGNSISFFRREDIPEIRSLSHSSVDGVEL